VAAQKQGNFLAFHREMMIHRGQVSEAVIIKAARTAQLDLNQLRQDMDSPATNAIIDRTRAGAAALDLNGTPALVVGETIIPGAVSIEKLQDVIDRERVK
jgi:protein-disulfide isomerase